MNTLKFQEQANAVDLKSSGKINAGRFRKLDLNFKSIGKLANIVSIRAFDKTGNGKMRKARG